MRLFIKILLSLVILLVVVLIIAVKPVDYAPYFESDYYEVTRARLAEGIKGSSSARGDLQIGFSKVNISPVATLGLDFGDHAIPMAGYGDREGLPAKGLHDSLFVKSVALKVQDQTLVILAADMLIIPPNVVEQVTSLLATQNSIRREQILYTATHTHSSMGGWSSNLVGEAFAGELQAELVNWLAGKFAQSIMLALEDLQAGELGHGKFEAPQLVKNRLVGEKGQEQATFSFLLAKQKEGRKAVIGLFNAHATTLSGDNWQFSADYPGYWYQKLEAQEFDLAVFCAGSVGSHGPVSHGKEFEKARYLGEALADSVLKHQALAEWQDTLTLASLQVKLEMPPFHVRLTDGWRLAPFLSKKLFPPIGEVVIQSVRLGDFIWTSTPADFSGELALHHQHRLHTKGFESVISSFNGGYIGYVLPDKYYHYMEYESRIMSWFGPNINPYLDEMIYRTSDHLTTSD